MLNAWYYTIQIKGVSPSDYEWYKLIRSIVTDECEKNCIMLNYCGKNCGCRKYCSLVDEETGFSLPVYLISAKLTGGCLLADNGAPKQLVSGSIILSYNFSSLLIIFNRLEQITHV